jgi:NADH-quinone oxidoreductase subunit C
MSDESAAVEDSVSEDSVSEDSVSEQTAPQRFGARCGESSGQAVLFATVDQYADVCQAAFDDGFDQLIDLTAVDYLTFAGARPLPAEVAAERYEVVTQLINHQRRERIRIRTQVPADHPEIASVFDLWPGSENLEREVFDMFGIVFTDHPDMSRVLMPESWDGHPLRKDYAIGSIPVQFKSASNQR